MQIAILIILFRIIVFILTVALIYAGYKNTDLPFKQAFVILNPVFFTRCFSKDEIMQIMCPTTPVSAR